jgi:hypothetical protein
VATACCIPWGGNQLIVGTGVHGKLPIMPAVEAEEKRHGIERGAVPAKQACQLQFSVNAVSATNGFRYLDSV